MGNTFDLSRLARGLRGPNMDTRVWLRVAYVTSFRIDADGVWADVRPTDERKTVYTARVGSPYAGNGFGFYAADMAVDDDVLIGAPDGNPNHGVVVLARLFSKAEPPPQLGIDHPEDVALVVKKDKTIRVAVSGGGNVAITVVDGKVLLGGESGTKPVARKDDAVKAGWLVFTPNVPPGGAANLQYLPPGTVPTPTVALYPPPLVLLALSGTIDGGSGNVEAS